MMLVVTGVARTPVLVEMAPRNHDREASYFLRADRLRQRDAGNLQRVGNVVRQCGENPAHVDFSLADLKSRLASSAGFVVRELNDEEQIAALDLRAQLRGFELPAETAHYLQRRFPRDMRTLCDILDTLDDAAFAAQRRLTVPFIRGVIDGR